MKKVNGCPDGGYVKLQCKLMSNQEVKCEACKILMQEKRFNPQDLESHLKKGGGGDGGDDGDAPGDLPVKVDAKPKPKHGQKDDDETVKDRREEALAWLRTMEPVISVLEVGSFGKKFPFRCNLCKSPHHPEGKVGELGAMSLGSVKHFVTQHMKSAKHIENRDRDLREPEDLEQARAQCEGLCVSHESAGQLYLHRTEFELWASLANFQGCAAHQYDRDATSGTWRAKSKSCEGECPVRPNADRQICHQCMMLGSGHSAAWHGLEIPSAVVLGFYRCCIAMQS